MRPLPLFGAVCAVVVGGTCAFAVHAADLGPAFPAPPAYAEPDAQYEFGTGWYLRGDAGYSDSSRQQVFGNLPDLTSSTDWTGGIGAGYRLNSWLRADLTLNFDGYQQKSALTGSNTICPYGLTGIYDQTTQLQYGYLWSAQAGTCSEKERADLLKNDVMVAGYVDIGTWGGLTPYVGAGVGFSRIDTWQSVNYLNNSNGLTYDANLTPTETFPEVWVNAAGSRLNPQPTVPTTGLPVSFATQNWSKANHHTQYNFAWSLMGGVAYAIDDHMSIDLGYRYVNLGSYKDGAGNSKTVDAQQVRLGVRYNID